jgi:4-diphosphocytidyl-2-C-methyl-D-erythritol kinase
VRAQAPGKVNLSLHCGPRAADGYHPLVTVFQAVSVYDEVTATLVPTGSGVSMTVDGPGSDVVPRDAGNLAWRAAVLLAAAAGITPDVALHIRKGVPVAGGMAGGSADAAAALVACDGLWETHLPREDLLDLAGQLGSDVPFCLMGHTAVGTGHGDLLTPAMTQGEFFWAFGISAQGLSTPAVFAQFDEMGAPGVVRDVDHALMQALRAGDAAALGAALHNDLEPAALALRPDLRRVFTVAHEAGALGVVLSGSGPTVAALASSRRHARVIAALWTAAGVVEAVCTATGPVGGAHLA